MSGTDLVPTGTTCTDLVPVQPAPMRPPIPSIYIVVAVLNSAAVLAFIVCTIVGLSI